MIIQKTSGGFAPLAPLVEDLI